MDTNYKIYIKYMRDGSGPYMAIFDTQQEAEEWVKYNDIDIKSIDFL